MTGEKLYCAARFAALAFCPLLLAAGCGDGNAIQECGASRPYADANLAKIEYAFPGYAHMRYAALDGSGEWKDIWTAPRRSDGEERESDKWKECKDDPTWFENAEGERISVERYCAILAAEGAQDARVWLATHCKGCDASTENRIVDAYRELTKVPWVDEQEELDFDVWELGEGLYLMMEREGTGVMNMRSYDVVMWDGATLRILVPFDSMPRGDRVLESILQARTNPAALNNIAAMVINDVADSHRVEDEYIHAILRMAASAGEPMACHNLAIFYDKNPLKDPKHEEKRDFWLRRAVACADAMAGGFAPAPLDVPLAKWPLIFHWGK